jgi:hypothetical protein
VYEDDCYAAIDRALAAAGDLGDEELDEVRTALSDVIDANPANADRIREIAAETDVGLDDL